MHTYYNECPRCGALLDPGERCSCADRQDRSHEDDGNIDLFYDLLEEQQENQR